MKIIELLEKINYHHKYDIKSLNSQLLNFNVNLNPNEYYLYKSSILYNKIGRSYQPNNIGKYTKEDTESYRNGKYQELQKYINLLDTSYKFKIKLPD